MFYVQVVYLLRTLSTNNEAGKNFRLTVMVILTENLFTEMIHIDFGNF